jgi:hypothetical protein
VADQLPHADAPGAASSVDAAADGRANDQRQFQNIVQNRVAEPSLQEITRDPMRGALAQDLASQIDKQRLTRHLRETEVNDAALAAHFDYKAGRLPEQVGTVQSADMSNNNRRQGNQGERQDDFEPQPAQPVKTTRSESRPRHQILEPKWNKINFLSRIINMIYFIRKKHI